MLIGLFPYTGLPYRHLQATALGQSRNDFRLVSPGFGCIHCVILCWLINLKSHGSNFSQDKFSTCVPFFQTIVLYPNPNIVTCTMRIWLREIGFALSYGALMLKTWR